MVKLWVKAKVRGQRPDGKWVGPSSPAFQVDEELFSAKWMQKADAPAEFEAQQKQADPKVDEPPKEGEKSPPSGGKGSGPKA